MRHYSTIRRALSEVKRHLRVERSVAPRSVALWGSTACGYRLAMSACDAYMTSSTNVPSFELLDLLLNLLLSHLWTVVDVFGVVLILL